jgi:hypothetical protein
MSLPLDERGILLSAREPLLALHQGLIQAERRCHEATAGPMNPAGFLQLLLNSEELAWLKPMTAAILAIDEQLDDAGTSGEAMAVSLASLRQLVGPGSEMEAHLAILAGKAPDLTTLRQKLAAALG